MDDMTAFERQLAAELGRMAGPGRRTDAMAMVRAVSTPSSRWRFQSTFDALKFVVAGVIVALFSGFVLIGVLAQPPSEESVPGVGASASASPETTTRTDLLPGEDLVTEEVEPGVLRVVNDGIRDLARPVPDYDYATWGFRVVAGLDGSVWMLGPEGRSRARFHGATAPPEQGDFFRLGYADTFSLIEGGAPDAFEDVEVGPDGTIWASGSELGAARPLDVGPGSRVAVGRPGRRCGRGRARRHGLGVSQTFDKVVLAHSADGTGPWVADVMPSPTSDADPSVTLGLYPSVGGLWASDDGDVWLWRRGDDREVFSRLHGTEWQHFRGARRRARRRGANGRCRARRHALGVRFPRGRQPVACPLRRDRLDRV